MQPDQGHTDLMTEGGSKCRWLDSRGHFSLLLYGLSQGPGVPVPVHFANTPGLSIVPCSGEQDG